MPMGSCIRPTAQAAGVFSSVLLFKGAGSDRELPLLSNAWAGVIYEDPDHDDDDNTGSSIPLETIPLTKGRANPTQMLKDGIQGSRVHRLYGRLYSGIRSSQWACQVSDLSR